MTKPTDTSHSRQERRSRCRRWTSNTLFWTAPRFQMIWIPSRSSDNELQIINRKLDQIITTLGDSFEEVKQNIDHSTKIIYHYQKSLADWTHLKIVQAMNSFPLLASQGQCSPLIAESMLAWPKK